MPELSVQIKGRTFPVAISRDGEFIVRDVDGEEVKSETMKGLKDKLTKIVSQKPLDLKFVCIEEVSGYRARGDGEEKLEFREGVVKSIHTRTGNLIVRWDGWDHNEQLSRYGYRSNLYDPKINRKKLLALYAAKNKAEKAYNDFLRAATLKVPGQ